MENDGGDDAQEELLVAVDYGLVALVFAVVLEKRGLFLLDVELGVTEQPAVEEDHDTHKNHGTGHSRHKGEDQIE